MIARRKPLKRSKRPPSKRPGGKRRSSRVRDLTYMLWCRFNLPCFARELGPCEGLLEFDHMGKRGLGQKSNDTEGAVLCSRHHLERDAFSGPFRSWNQARMRAWKLEAIRATREAYDRRFNELPF